MAGCRAAVPSCYVHRPGMAGLDERRDTRLSALTFLSAASDAAGVGLKAGPARTRAGGGRPGRGRQGVAEIHSRRRLGDDDALGGPLGMALVDALAAFQRKPELAAAKAGVRRRQHGRRAPRGRAWCRFPARTWRRWARPRSPRRRAGLHRKRRWRPGWRRTAGQIAGGAWCSPMSGDCATAPIHAPIVGAARDRFCQQSLTAPECLPAGASA